MAQATLALELEKLREQGLIVKLDAKEKTDAHQRDRARAIHYGRRYASRVVKTVAEAGTWSAAIAATDSSLKRLAATESSQALNEEREQTLRTAEHTETAFGFVLFKWWDASMDRRTCPICERANGTIRPPGLGFPDGIPGDVHPNCRCYTALIALPITYDYNASLYGS